jgi:hypothetical protein
MRAVRWSLRHLLEGWLLARETDPGWTDLLEEVGRRDAPLENPWEASSPPASESISDDARIGSSE